MDITQIMQQAQKVQETLKKVQAELALMQITGEAGAGMVKTTVNGRYQILSIEIDDEIYKEGKTIVSDLIIAAVNDALTKVQEQSQEKMKQCASGFGLPANMNFPFMPGGDTKNP